jgi:RimJ/RimL family protein N-acetyltransferase
VFETQKKTVKELLFLITDMFETRRLIFRGYRPSDRDFFLDLLDDYHVTVHLTSKLITLNYEDHQAWLDKMIKSFLFVVVVNRETNERMGFALVNIFTPMNLDGDFGIALCKEWWNHGYGTEILQWAMEYSFRALGLRRLSLVVWSSNPRAIAVYEKVYVAFYKGVSV